MSNAILNQALTAAKAVKAEVVRLKEDIATLDAEAEQLEKQKTNLQSTPVSIEDVKQAMFQYIDARGALFLRDGEYRKALNAFLYPPRDAISIDAPSGRQFEPLNFLEAKAVSKGDPDGKVFGSQIGIHPKLFSPNWRDTYLSDVLFYFFFGDVIKSKIEEYMPTLIPGHSLAHKDVVATVADLENKISMIDHRLAEIVSERSALERQVNELVKAVKA